MRLYLLKMGIIVKTFTAKDGRAVVLRTPRWEDLDDLLEFINSLVEEGAEIGKNQKVTRDEEMEWLARKLIDVEKDNVYCILAEVDGKVIANSELRKRRGDASHVGEIGIAVKDGYRDIGLGTEMLKTLISQAKMMSFKLLILNVYSSNERAIHVYKKVGFTEIGRIPNGLFKNGNYLDDIILGNKIE